MTREAENVRKKILVLIHSNPTQNREFRKNSKKIQKIKKHHYGFFSSQNGTGDAVNVRKKIHVLIHSHSTRNMEFQKNSKKIKKIIKRHCGFFSTQNRTGHAETEWKKVFSFRSIQPQPEIGNSKKIAKEIQKMKKKSLWLLFKPKRDGKGWEWEKKNILVPIHSNTTQNRDFQKNSQKLQKIKKHYYGFISTKNGIGLVEIERKKKIIVPIHSIPTRNRDFQKNSKKIEKIKKIIKRHCGFFSSQNRTGQAENEWKKVFSFRSIQHQPGIGNSIKIAK